jgi:hypothetical protein
LDRASPAQNKEIHPPQPSSLEEQVAEPANMDRTNKRFQKFNLVVKRTNRKNKIPKKKGRVEKLGPLLGTMKQLNKYQLLDSSFLYKHCFCILASCSWF